MTCQVDKATATPLCKRPAAVEVNFANHPERLPKVDKAVICLRHCTRLLRLGYITPADVTVLKGGAPWRGTSGKCKGYARHKWRDGKCVRCEKQRNPRAA